MKKLSKSTAFLLSIIATMTFSNISFAKDCYKESSVQGSIECMRAEDNAKEKQITKSINSLKNKIHKKRFDALVASQKYWYDSIINHCKFRYHYDGTKSFLDVSVCVNGEFASRTKNVKADIQNILKNPNRNKPVEYESSNLYEIESKITEMQYKNIYELLKKHDTPNYESLQRIKFYIEHYDAWRTFAENFCDFYSNSYRTCKRALYTAKLKLFDRDYKFLTTPPKEEGYMFPDY